MQHHFDVEVAQKYGILPAVIINHFAFWIRKNEAERRNYHDGDYWTHTTISALKELFPYASDRQIRYAIDKLVEDGIIKTGNYNEKPFDHTLWYAFDKIGKSILQNCQIEVTNLSNRFDTSVKSLNTDNNPYNNPYNNQWSAEMTDALNEWCKYKAEKRQKYTPTGYKQLCDKLNSEINSRGEKTVISGIKNSMANGWQGIYYHEEKKKKPGEERPASYDIDRAVEKMMTTVPKLRKRK